MPRFLEALKSIIAQPERIMVVESTTSSYSTLATELLQELMMTMQSYIPNRVKFTMTNHFTEFVSDKSQSELIFLLSIVLAVLLFVIILPAYETLFGSYCCDDEQYDGKEYHMSSSGGMRLYKPGVGVVTMDVEDIADMTDGSSSSSRSVGSHGSFSMETIEESEEEDDIMDEDHDDEVDSDAEQEDHEEEVVDELQLHQEQELSAYEEEANHDMEPQDFVRAMSCPALASSDEEEDNDDAVSDKVKYYEFLNYLNSEASPRNYTVQEDHHDEDDEASHSSSNENTQEHYFATPTPSSPRAQDDDDSQTVTSELTSSSQLSTSSLWKESLKERLSKSSAAAASKRTFKKLSSARW